MGLILNLYKSLLLCIIGKLFHFSVLILSEKDAKKVAGLTLE